MTLSADATERRVVALTEQLRMARELLQEHKDARGTAGARPGGRLTIDRGAADDWHARRDAFLTLVTGPPAESITEPLF